MRDYDRKFSEIIEKVIQSEGLQQASNNDSIDMEVSSG
jgi:hypothetical protein